MDEINRNRLEEFRQLREEVRHSEEYLIVGIDIAKDRHYAFFGTPTGKILLKRIVISNDYEGFRKLLDQAEALRVQHGLKKVIYGMEPTANYHKTPGRVFDQVREGGGVGLWGDGGEKPGVIGWAVG